MADQNPPHQPGEPPGDPAPLQETGKRSAEDEPEGRQPATKRARFEVSEPSRATGLKRRKWKLTKLAKLFGPEPLFDDGSSGFTPIDLDKNTVSEMEWELWKSEHQEAHFYQFDSKSLQAIDAALPLIDAEKQSTLTNAIHPIFQQQNWMRRQDVAMNTAFWRIGMGHAGYWEVSC
jgi:hypothetical protein